MDPTYPPPTEEEWAKQDVTVIKRSDPQIIGLRKEITKNGVPYMQTVWLTFGQLRGLTIEATF